MPEWRYLGAKRVICPSCHRDIYYEQWEGKPEVTKSLACPWCGSSLGVTGTVDSLAVLEGNQVICVTPERARSARAREAGEQVCPRLAPKDEWATKLATLPQALKSPEWWRKYGVWVGIFGIGTILAIVLLKKKK